MSVIMKQVCDRCTHTIKEKKLAEGEVAECKSEKSYCEKCVIEMKQKKQTGQLHGAGGSL